MTSLAVPSVARVLPVDGGSAELRQWLEDRLLQGAGQERHLWLVLPAPVRPVESLPAVSETADFVDQAGHSVVWDPPNGMSMSGIGAAWKMQLQGTDRFRRLRDAADPVLKNIASTRHSAAPNLEPRVLGGFAFDEGAADQDPWQDFGDGCFSLPRFVYGVDESQGVAQAGLALAVHGGELVEESSRRSWLDATMNLLQRLEELDSSTSSGLGRDPMDGMALLSGPEGVVGSEDVDDPDWIHRIEEIREAIARGDVQKIVAARRCEVDLRSPLAMPEVLALLGRDLRASTRFAFGRSKSTFLGVTPERLLAKEGRRIHTEALAGSIERGHAADLLDSGKDRLEQQLVVDSIVRRLEPLCDRLQVAAKPTIRELRDVLHLHTPILGALKESCHILDLVETLHPTPAVGGVPTPAAMEWIRNRETHARGWYAAPIGWFDAQGDGELAVALRSCVLTHRKAYLFVGAGIVSDSDPVAELQETELKKQALLSALQG